MYVSVLCMCPCCISSRLCVQCPSERSAQTHVGKRTGAGARVAFDPPHTVAAGQQQLGRGSNSFAEANVHEVMGRVPLRLVATGGRAQSDDEEEGEGNGKAHGTQAAAARRAASSGKRKVKEDEDMDDAPAGIFCPHACVCVCVCARALVHVHVRVRVRVRVRACSCAHVWRVRTRA